MQPPMAQAVEQFSMTTDRAEWEFARPTTPGRRACRRGSAKWIRSLGTNLGRWRRQKKNTRMTNSRNRRLSQSSRGGSERKNARWLPAHSPWSTSTSWGPKELVGEEPAHSVGSPLVECFGFGAAGRQTRVRKGHWTSSEVRCTRHAEAGRSRCGCRSIVLRRAHVCT